MLFKTSMTMTEIVERGMIDLAVLEAAVDDSVAALMVTNPNTVGIFEEDIAKAALFLVSDESDWVTGTCMVVDGGQLAG